MAGMVETKLGASVDDVLGDSASNPFIDGLDAQLAGAALDQRMLPVRESNTIASNVQLRVIRVSVKQRIRGIKDYLVFA